MILASSLHGQDSFQVCSGTLGRHSTANGAMQQQLVIAIWTAIGGRRLLRGEFSQVCPKRE